MPTSGQTTDWMSSKPFYEQLLAMGNEIGTHSYTHPEDTNVLTPAQIQFEFEQSKLLLEQKLGITIEGAAVPGAPESLATSQLIGQYFSYMTGGYTGVGAGYPGAFGYLTPGSDSVYLAPNMKFDFSLVEALPEYGGGMNAEQAKAEWIREFNELSMKSDMPVFVWPWHDYGPTQWMVNRPRTLPIRWRCTPNSCAMPISKDTEFVTMAGSRAAHQSVREGRFQLQLRQRQQHDDGDGYSRRHGQPDRHLRPRCGKGQDDRQRIRLVCL